MVWRLAWLLVLRGGGAVVWEWRRQDRAAVLDALKNGERPFAAMAAGLTELDELAYLAYSLGVFEALQLLKVGRKRDGIPDDLLKRTLVVLPFIQAFSFDGGAKALLGGFRG